MDKEDKGMAHQIFVSHTKKDAEFCDILDRVCARIGLRAFRSEFEKIELPAWKTIKDAMDKYIAMFLLIGSELVNAQELREADWTYVQNWIAYEIGLACERGIDVWVVCDDVKINFPVPYFNNYSPFSFRDEPNFSIMRGWLEIYNKGYTFPAPGKDIERKFTFCPYNDDCGIEFNLHATLEPEAEIICPACLRTIVHRKGFPLE